VAFTYLYKQNFCYFNPPLFLYEYKRVSVRILNKTWAELRGVGLER
jgi:hypothetical protein